MEDWHDLSVVSDRSHRRDRRVLRLLGLGSVGQVCTLADPGPCEPRPLCLDLDPRRRAVAGRAYLASDGLGGIVALYTTGPEALSVHDCAWDNHIIAVRV